MTNGITLQGTQTHGRILTPHSPYSPSLFLIPSHKQSIISEVLPAAGAVLIETGDLKEVLCKPKLMAIKSSELVKLEKNEVRDEKAMTAATVGAASTAGR